jgi:RNA polymerase sigma-70 factor (ECF subfamily)
MTEKRGARDQRARFEALAHVVTVPLHRYLLRRAEPDQVDDVLAETLLVLWRRIEDVPGLEPEHVLDPDAVLPWCYGVARGCLANARRADRRRHSLLERLTWTAVTTARVAEPADADHTALHAALAQLRALEREIVRRRHAGRIIRKKLRTEVMARGSNRVSGGRHPAPTLFTPRGLTPRRSPAR